MSEATAAAGARVETASHTDVGRLRSHNEDACGEFEDAAGRRLLVVADGMGGHKGGATASRMAVEIIGEQFQASSDEPADMLLAALEEANRRIYRTSRETDDLRGMGTTAVLALLDGPDAAWIAHVGDSRAYRLRAGRIEALTEDHSVVAEMQRRGLLSEEEAAVHPRRNEILRSVGVEPDVRADVLRVVLEPGDVLMLCSDGLCGQVGAEEMAAVLGEEPPERAVRRLVDRANELGGPDNITVQVAAIGASGTATRATAEPTVEASVDRPVERAEPEAASAEASIPKLAVGVGLAVGIAALLWWLVAGG